MGEDLVAVELEDGAGGSLAGFWIVHGRHALFDGEEAGSEGRTVGFALEGCSRGAVESWFGGVVGESVGFGCKGRLDGANGRIYDGWPGDLGTLLQETSCRGWEQQGWRRKPPIEGYFGRHGGCSRNPMDTTTTLMFAADILQIPALGARITLRT